MTEKVNLALTKKSTQLVEKKLAASVVKVERLENLQKLWLGVVMQAVRDLSACESEARAARFYLLNDSCDFDRVADLAGLDSGYVRRVILAVAKKQELQDTVGVAA